MGSSAPPPPRLLCSWVFTSCRPHGPLCALPPRRGPGPTGPVGISAQSSNDGAAEDVKVIPFSPRPRPLRGHTGTRTCFSSRSQDGLEGGPAASISGDHLQPQSVPFQSAGTWSLYERHHMERLSFLPSCSQRDHGTWKCPKRKVWGGEKGRGHRGRSLSPAPEVCEAACTQGVTRPPRRTWRHRICSR